MDNCHRSFVKRVKRVQGLESVMPGRIRYEASSPGCYQYRSCDAIARHSLHLCMKLSIRHALIHMRNSLKENKASAAVGTIFAGAVFFDAYFILETFSKNVLPFGRDGNNFFSRYSRKQYSRMRVSLAANICTTVEARRT